MNFTKTGEFASWCPDLRLIQWLVSNLAADLVVRVEFDARFRGWRAILAVGVQFWWLKFDLAVSVQFCQLVSNLANGVEFGGRFGGAWGSNLHGSLRPIRRAVDFAHPIWRLASNFCCFGGWPPI